VERPGLERGTGSLWRFRRKGGLETPLGGRFIGEAKWLMFAPPAWYDALVVGCIVAGPTMALFGPRFGWFAVSVQPNAFIVGVCVCVAGLWGALSSERMTCDLRNRTYYRREGQGFGKRATRGGLNELDAVVLSTEEYPLALLGKTVIYRLVIHWKGSKEPLLVVEQETHTLGPGSPLNKAAGGIAQRGARYAQAMGVPFYDNSYFHSSAPVPVL
jgi:hypothetical protein